MKTHLIASTIVSITVVSQLAFGCPTLNPVDGYAEAAVPCTTYGLPDFSKEPAVNQRDSSGGECRTVTERGSFYSVRGQELVLVNNQGQTKHLGYLTEKPSCYQTDTHGQFYSTWVQVEF